MLRACVPQRPQVGSLGMLPGGGLFRGSVAGDHLNQEWAELAAGLPQRVAERQGGFCGHLPRPADALPLWTALGLRADLAEKVVQHWRLLWKDGALWILDVFQHDPDFMEDLCNTCVGLLSI
eukprot:2994432-Lingulodinium_polyedra.AAC.1